MSSFYDSENVRLAEDFVGHIGDGVWLSLISARIAFSTSSFTQAKIFSCSLQRMAYQLGPLC